VRAKVKTLTKVFHLHPISSTNKARRWRVG